MIMTQGCDGKAHVEDSVDDIAVLVRLFRDHFALPAELSLIILDYGGFWASAIYPVTRSDRPIIGYSKMITTSPFSDAAMAHEGLLGCRRVRGLKPCRRIRIKLWARALARQITPKTPIPRLPPHMYVNPFTVNVVWPDYNDDSMDVPAEKSMERVFAPSNLPAVHSLYHRDQDMPGQENSRWMISVFKEPLSKDSTEERETVWDWTDDGPGVDLVRCLEVGDALQIRTKRVIYPPPLVVPRIEIEMYFVL